MLPVEKANGEIWLQEQFLCAVEYEIGEPLRSAGGHQVQRIILVVADEHATRLDTYNLVLIIADGSRHAIPRPLQRIGLGTLECYVESVR